MCTRKINRPLNLVAQRSQFRLQCCSLTGVSLCMNMFELVMLMLFRFNEELRSAQAILAYDIYGADKVSIEMFFFFHGA